MNTQKIFFVFLVLFIILSFFIPHSLIPTDLGNTILTIVAFLFGIIAGFYIIVTTTDFNGIKNMLASETAGWISLYQNLFIYDKIIAEKFSLLIDAYIRRNFDFEVIDYVKSTQTEFETVNKLVREIPLSTKSELAPVYQNIQNLMDNIITTRQQLTVLGTKTISTFSWTILLTLAGILIFSLYGLRTGELFFDIVAVAVSSAVVLVLLLIRDLDLYIWNEKTFGYDVFENVFKSIGQLSYYPVESIKKGRVNPLEKEYRVGTYIDFPKSTERKIEIYKS